MIRKAMIQDIKFINELGKIVNKDFAKLFKMDEILKEKYSKVFVCETEEKIVGFLHVTELTDTIDIINIVIESKSRNKGIASLLIDYMFSDANATVKLVTLEVAVDNKSAISLYEKFGFEIMNTRRGYYSDSDAYLMGKRLGE